MSKKFLTESQVRRFQALAAVPAVNELGGTPYGEVHEEMPEEEYSEEGELEMGDELPGDEGPEETGLEMDMDMEASDEGGELDLSPEQKETLAADIVRAVAQELEGALQLDEPIEVDVEAEPAMDMEPEGEMDMGDEEVEMELDVDEEPMMETGRKDTGASKGDESKTHRGEKDYTTKKGEKLKVGGKGRGEKPGDEAYVNEESTEEVAEALDDEALVNEVLRRVVKRLSKK